MNLSNSRILQSQGFSFYIVTTTLGQHVIVFQPSPLFWLPPARPLHPLVSPRTIFTDSRALNHIRPFGLSINSDTSAGRELIAIIRLTRFLDDLVVVTQN